MKFGEKIKRLREEAEISQTELGNAVHMTQRKVSYIECGKCEPSIDDIIALCNYFKVTSDYLLGIQKGYRHPKW